MEYVMVPVPEELEDEVELLLRWKLRFPKDDVDEASLAAAFERAVRELDEPSAKLLVSVARRTVDGEPFSVADAGKILGCNAREITGIVLELNVAVEKMGGLSATMLLPEKEGETSFANRLFFMRPDIAAMVLDAANAP